MQGSASGGGQPYSGSLHEGARAPKQNPQACSSLTIPLQALRQSMLFCWNPCLGEAISGKSLLYALMGDPPWVSWVFWWPRQSLFPLSSGARLYWLPFCRDRPEQWGTGDRGKMKPSSGCSSVTTQVQRPHSPVCCVSGFLCQPGKVEAHLRQLRTEKWSSGAKTIS